VGGKVEGSEMKIKGADYKEMSRYVAENDHLCSDLSEIRRIFPWRKSKRGGKKAGMVFVTKLK
jgi:hypothetical protein